MSDEICTICGSKKSEHVATAKGPFTHPREASGEGTYERRTGTLGRGPMHDDEPFEAWVFVPATKTTPPTYDDRIAGLRERRAIAFLASREALNDVCRDALALASELAAKLKEAKEDAKFTWEQETSGIENEKDSAWHIRKLLRDLESEQQAHASTKRELEQERGRKR